MVAAASFALIFAFSIFFFVPLHPSHVGLIIEDMTHNELLITCAIENKDVFDKVVRDNNLEEGRKSTVEDKVAEV